MNIPKQNLHTHTIYCDGANTPEEFVKASIASGFEGIGFSSHSYQYFSPKYTMLEEPALQYKAEVNALKEKYRGKLSIFCGLECDMYSTCITEDYDFLIGSSHFMRVGDDIFEFDKRVDIFEGLLEKYFDGNIKAFLRKYFEDFADLKKRGNYDIVGHFDIVTRHCEKNPFFDESDKEYMTLAKECIHALAKDFDIFEVNFGPVVEGVKSIPYPAPELIKELKAVGCSIILSSDAHSIGSLAKWDYNAALELVRSCGYDEILILTENGFKGIKI